MDQLDYDARKAALIAEITAAFDGVAREDSVTLHETYILDDYGGDAELLRARDTDNRWQDVPDRHIRDSASHIVFIYLDPKGFRYYLPAFMVWCLEDKSTISGWRVLEGVESTLVLFFEREHDEWDDEGWEDERWREHVLAKFRTLNQTQSRAVAHFLLFVIEKRKRYSATLQNEFDDERLIQRLISKGTSLDGIRERIQSVQESTANFHLKAPAYQALKSYWGQFL